jgi:hypothetical protein
MAFGSNAFACYEDGRYRLCPGDRVVSPDNYTGRVLGVNPSRGTAVLDLDDFSSNYSYSINAIYVTDGCVVNLCVGDRVTSSDNYTGWVIGINPHTFKVVLDLDLFSSHYAYHIDAIHSGYGCVGDVCVGDEVISPDNYEGVVLGVNPFSGSVSVDLANFSNNYSYSYSDISLTTVCADYDSVFRRRARQRGIVHRNSYNHGLTDQRQF